LQKVEHASAKIAEIVASEYVASERPLAINKAVGELLHPHHYEHGGDELKLCKMIIDGTLHNCMCESPLASQGELHPSWSLFHTAPGAQK
jgi:hypothetical protein